MVRFARRRPSLPKGWEPDASVINEFHEYLLKQSAALHRSRVDRESHLDPAAAQARNVRHRRSAIEDSQKVAIETDPMVLKAIDAMPRGQSAARQIEEADRRSASSEIARLTSDH